MSNNTSRSQALWQKAEHYMPGGVNSPVRAFRAVGGTPRFIARAEGAHVFDVDGNRYIDYVGSWGPMILGHAHPEVIKAVQATAAHGLSFGAPTELEVQLSEAVCRRVPSMEQVRFVSSGTEATMSAIRLARGFTNRNKIIKFAGCYHGHADSLLVQAGSGLLTFGTPSSKGVAPQVVADTLVADFNDLDSVEKLFKQYGDDIAAILIEPVAGNMNLILPLPGFLQGLRNLCDQYGALLIFDEVMTGFRVDHGGAQKLFNIKPDLTTLGKIVGGGMPVGAFGGRRDIMAFLSPLGPVYQAGTLSGNPVAMAAGLTTLKLIDSEDFYLQLEQKTKQLMDGITQVAKKADVPIWTTYCGSMFGIFFSERPVHNFADVMACDVEKFKQFFQHTLNQGIYFAPSAFEAGFMSAAHSDQDIQQTLRCVERALLLN